MVSSNTVENLATDQTRSLPHTAIVSSREFFLEGLWAQRLERLLSIRSLREDWDGDGAGAPIPEVVDAAIYFLDRIHHSEDLPIPDRIVPSPNGTVVIEWQLPPHTYLEAEIATPGTIEWMSQEGTQDARHWVTVLEAEIATPGTIEWMSQEGTQDTGHRVTVADLRQTAKGTSSLPVYRAA